MSLRAKIRFLVSGGIGFAFFLLPVPFDGRLTVPFDLAIRWVTGRFSGPVAVYCLAAVVLGSIATVLATRKRVPESPTWWSGFRSSPAITAVRLAGLPLALLYFFGWGPAWLADPAVKGLMWDTLALSVAVIIPVGAAFLVLFVCYGFLEFVGTLMRPVMRPAFRLPGRSALDSVTSWVGSYSVGLYLTRQLFVEGYYTKREAYTIATCFSTVSIGFVAVVLGTLDLMPYFPIVFLTYFVCVYLLTAILARMWPIRGVPEEYVAPPRPEVDVLPNQGSLLVEAWRRALTQAEKAPGLGRTLRDGVVEGVLLAATILGSILTVGTAALLVARETPVFDWLGQPFVPVLILLGIPDAEIVAPALLVGITEMYIPALLVVDASLPARFFVALLSVSQLIFFSSLGPMILDMFRGVPIRGRELVALFLIRTAILVPLLAAATAFFRLVTASG